MKHAARITDDHVCPKASPAVHVGGLVAAAVPLGIQAESRQAARLADYAACHGPMDVVFEGAATVLVGGLPFTGVSDKTAHGGFVLTAAATVFLGGPTFSLPPNFVAKGSAAFQNALIRDLFYLSTLPSGRELLERLAKSGKTITFQPCYDPHNSFCAPASPTAAALGMSTGSTIEYNPNVAMYAYDDGGMLTTQPPQCVLAHEMVHAIDNAEGHHCSGLEKDKIPNLAPASEPDIAEEEAAAIGVGSHKGDYPTENSLRGDMGLPRRADHWADFSPTTPTDNFRPGGY